MIRSPPLLALALAAMPLGATPRGEAVHAVLIDLQTADMRVAAIGWRLLTANASRCPRQMPGTGLVLHGLDQYPPGPAREAALALQPGLGKLTVLGVVPGSPAAAAGLAAGDAIESIGGQPLSALPLNSSHASALRDAAERELAGLPPAAPVVLGVRRGAEQRSVTLAAVPACRSRLEVVAGEALRARSDGELIQIGQGFAASLSDDGLALVLAHELAHTVLDHHRGAKAGATTLARRERKAMSRRLEDEADLLSLELLSGAGWDPAIAPRFLRQQAKALDRFASGGVHRKAADRAERMERALAGASPDAG
ncbi:MAG: PDZ domain-containing protein [Novosphingobium sp.]